MAAGKKLFLSRSVRVLRLLYLFPEGRKWKRECPGCVGGVLDYLCWLLFPEAAGSVDGVNGQEAGLSDGLGFFHDPFVVYCGLGQSRSHTKL